MRTLTWISCALLVGGCYDAADPLDTDPGTDGSSDGEPSSSSPTAASSSDTQTSAPTTTSPTTSVSSTDPSDTDSSDTDPSDTDPSDTDPDSTGTETTGTPAACGDGMVDAGELCLPRRPDLFDVDAGAFDLALADIDGDGLDVITLNRTSATISVLRNDGVGGLGNAANENVGDGSCRIRAADGDGDGDTDLVISGSPVVTLVNDGTGDFDRNDAPFDAGGFSGCSDVHDLGVLQGDGGPLDIVYSGEYNNTFATGVSPAGGWTFDEDTHAVDNAGEGSSGVTVTRLAYDGDDFDDVVVLNKYGTSGSLWRGNGSGSFSAAGTYLACDGIDSGSRFAATGDFDSDGQTDIVTTCVSGFQDPADAFSITLGNEDGSFDAPLAIDLVGAFRPLVVDLDGDDYDDILVASSIDFSISVYVNDGAGNFADPVVLLVGEPLYSLAVGDIDGDGAQDVATAYDTPAGGHVAVFFADP